MSKIILMNVTDQLAFVKVISDGSGSETLEISKLAYKPKTEKPFQVPYEKKPFAVTIKGVEWSGETGGLMRIKRGGERIMTLESSPQGLLQFDGQQFCAESQNMTDDFEFEFGGAPMEAWLTLRKMNYRSIGGEYAEYGAYEDEDRLGARTDIPGSPDYGEEDKQK